MKSSKPILIGVVVVVVLIAAMYGTMEATSQPSFCANCHYIKPAVEAWRHGGHKDVSCLQCHADPGPIGYVSRKVGAVKELYEHVTGTYPNHLQAKVNIENCVICHSGQLKAKYPKAKDITKHKGDTVVPFNHSGVLSAKESCLECHASVAHGTLGDDQ